MMEWELHIHCQMICIPLIYFQALEKGQKSNFDPNATKKVNQWGNDDNLFARLN